MNGGLINRIRLWRLKRKYRVGAIVTSFIACDVRRDVEVIDSSEIERGVIRARTRTWNVLYHIEGLKQRPSFGDVRRIEISKLWDWDGEPWGGPVPSSTDAGEC